MAGTAIAASPSGFQGGLSGFNEVPTISTSGHGAFFARINEQLGTIDYELTYDGMEGEVLQAHIHLGQPEVIGAIVVFLCTNLGNGPAGTQTCPQSPGLISGTITETDVTGIAAVQGLAAGEFDELVAAIRAGKTYVNVHSDAYQGGEIRSTLRPRR
jgi:hypothetical protein